MRKQGFFLKNPAIIHFPARHLRSSSTGFPRPATPFSGAVTDTKKKEYFQSGKKVSPQALRDHTAAVPDGSGGLTGEG